MLTFSLVSRGTFTTFSHSTGDASADTRYEPL
jgi:hypothetical protein